MSFVQVERPDALCRDIWLCKSALETNIDKGTTVLREPAVTLLNFYGCETSMDLCNSSLVA